MLYRYRLYFIHLSLSLSLSLTPTGIVDNFPFSKFQFLNFSFCTFVFSVFSFASSFSFLFSNYSNYIYNTTPTSTILFYSKSIHSLIHFVLILLHITSYTFIFLSTIPLFFPFPPLTFLLFSNIILVISVHTQIHTSILPSR